MRPKPSRDWVMLELERLGVRVVSGRLGRKAGEEDEEVPTSKKPGGKSVVDESHRIDNFEYNITHCSANQKLLEGHLRLIETTAWDGQPAQN
jgi:hypothetical protein